MPDNGKGENIEVWSRIFLDQEFIQKHNESPEGSRLSGMLIVSHRGTVQKIRRDRMAKVKLDGQPIPIFVPIGNLNLTKS
jgi:hypothetical protein